jgi:uncharacterized C2H2 Zn-finger protein
LSRELWIDHIGLDHSLAPDWQSQQCPLCLEQTGSGKGSTLVHLARHLEDIALASLPKGSDSEVNSENGSILLNEGNLASEPETDSDKDNNAHYFNQNVAYGISEKNGNVTPIAEGSSSDETYSPCSLSEEAVDDDGDDDDNSFRRLITDIPRDVLHVCRDCKKEFKRPCDLTKHEKTHSRPWKCTEEKCKYYDLGWPTEEERDRHVNDKHSAASPQYKCQYPPCMYAFKRESDCMQHMEKAHGWENIRPNRDTNPPSLWTRKPGSTEYRNSPPANLSDFKGEYHQHTYAGDLTLFESVPPSIPEITRTPISPSQNSTNDVENPAALPCPHCGRKFTGDSKKGNMSRHIRTKHSVPGRLALEYSCTSVGCGKFFWRNDAKLNHERKEHPELGRMSAVPKKPLDSKP